MTGNERLQFAVAFAARDLNTLTRGGWMVLRENLQEFVTGGLTGTDPKDLGGFVPDAMDDIPSLPDPNAGTLVVSDDTIRTLQREVRATLYALLGEAPPPGEPALPADPAYWRLASLRLTPMRTGSDTIQVLVRGNTRDVFRATLMLLLARQPFDKVNRCPECGAIFARVRKQIYCTPKCLNRVNMRTWREQKRSGSRRRKS